MHKNFEFYAQNPKILCIKTEKPMKPGFSFVSRTMKNKYNECPVFTPGGCGFKATSPLLKYK